MPDTGLPVALALFDIGPMEFMVVVAAAIMLFGGDLPDVARKAGRTVRKLRTLASEATKNLQTAGDMSRLPGAAEFRQGLDAKDDLDLAKEADIDWHEVARLPAPAKSAPAAPPAPARSAEAPVTPAPEALEPAPPVRPHEDDASRH